MFCTLHIAVIFFLSRWLDMCSTYAVFGQGSELGFWEIMILIMICLSFRDGDSLERKDGDRYTRVLETCQF